MEHPIEYTRSDVIHFLELYNLFKMTLNDRLEELQDSGKIDEEWVSANVAEAQQRASKSRHNALLKRYLKISPILRNEYLEAQVMLLTGQKIKIVNYPDEKITGVACPACDYIVYEDSDSAFFEICPLCLWKNDGTADEQYSGANHITMQKYKTKSIFKQRVRENSIMYKSSLKGN